MSAAVPRLSDWRAEWVTTQVACQLLGLSDRIDAGLLTGLEWRRLAPDGVPGRPPRLWRRRDIERAACIARAARLPVNAAVRVVIAEKEGRL